mgnify:CR=1 FL=1
MNKSMFIRISSALVTVIFENSGFVSAMNGTVAAPEPLNILALSIEIILIIIHFIFLLFFTDKS